MTNEQICDEINNLCEAIAIIDARASEMSKGWADRGSALDRAREILTHAIEHLERRKEQAHAQYAAVQCEDCGRLDCDINHFDDEDDVRVQWDLAPGDEAHWF